MWHNTFSDILNKYVLGILSLSTQNTYPRFFSYSIRIYKLFSRIHAYFRQCCGHCEAVYFGKSIRYLFQMSTEDLPRITIVKKMKLRNTEKQITTLAGIRKKNVDRKNMLIPRKTKEAIYCLKNPNNINKNSFMLSQIWLPNLGSPY